MKCNPKTDHVLEYHSSYQTALTVSRGILQSPGARLGGATQETNSGVSPASVSSPDFLDRFHPAVQNEKAEGEAGCEREGRDKPHRETRPVVSAPQLLSAHLAPPPGLPRGAPNQPLLQHPLQPSSRGPRAGPAWTELCGPGARRVPAAGRPPQELGRRGAPALHARSRLRSRGAPAAHSGGVEAGELWPRAAPCDVAVFRRGF